jgi:guanylate kinase
LEKISGLIFVVSAPSGAGKTTLIEKLRKEFPELRYSVSTTTRKPREGEINGESYHFVDESKFSQMIKEGDFLEWAIIHGNHYGTTKQSAMDVLNSGFELLLDLDIQGAASLRSYFKESANFIFIVPPSMEELKKRLVLRGTESESTLKTRLENGAMEMKEISMYDFVVVNDQLDIAYEDFKVIYKACHFRVINT